MRISRRPLLSITLLALFAFSHSGHSQTAPRRLHAQVVSVNGDEVTLKTRDGEAVRVKPSAATRWIEVLPASIDKVEPGLFVGTTASSQPDGSLVASEVHLFPESMRGLGEGHRPIEGNSSTSSMTNATVSNVEAVKKRTSSMTNATVAQVNSNGGAKRLTLKYSGGEKTVLIPPGTPVVLYAPGDRGMLRAGANVFTVASVQPDGSLVPAFFMIGRDGLVPPL